jgi:polyhydroxyalkanoate synthesis repressor PhaR
MLHCSINLTVQITGTYVNIKAQDCCIAAPGWSVLRNTCTDAKQVSGHDLGRAERSLLRVKVFRTNNSLLPQAGAQVPVLDRSALKISTASKTALEPMKTPATVIKKYGNRRLYDTAAKQYVNLDDIAALIREGTEVKVVDAKTGEDLTRVTLTQIITEDAKDRPTGLPLELLRQLIVASDHARQEFIMWYLKSAFDTYQTVKDAVEHRLSNMQSALLSPAEAVKRFMTTASPSPPQPASSASELEQLRQQVANLEARLKKPRTKKSKRKKS